MAFQITENTLIRYDGADNNVVIPDNITRIENFAFQRCADIKSVVIPESVTSIGRAVFFGCENLTSVKLPGGLKEMGGRCVQRLLFS